MSQHSLTIFKASAGSGKTFTLSTEYIKLLIKQPYNYRSILAVTFTNKATEEMKHRILSQLYGIWKRLPDSKNYIDKITTELGINASEAAKQAGIALNLIIHDYSRFRIETIDSFFQGILRNLERELNLTTNRRLELNGEDIAEQAVDEIIEQLGEKDDVFQWILSFIGEKIDSDKSWNVIKEIKEFSKNIFLECYKLHSDELYEVAKGNFFDVYKKELYGIIGSFERKMARYSETFEEELCKKGLEISDFFHGVAGPCSYFIKLGKGILGTKDLLTTRVLAAIDNPDGWVSKPNKGKDKTRLDAARALASSVLIPLLNEAEEMRKSEYAVYKSSCLVLKNLNSLRLLTHIENKVRRMNAEANRFLLSDTQTLLGSLIQESDAPFIYEKTGIQLNHIMIDEFQDTSTVQWKNFKVLLDECMSRMDEGNLIVGDVKQSIYRWRSGDWRLLNDIMAQFPHNAARIEQKTLDTNYRSERNIVDFNNAFFKRVIENKYAAVVENTGSEDLAGLLLQAYTDVVQKTSGDKDSNGLVDVFLLPKDVNNEQMLGRTANIIADLTSKGVKPSDIAILVRSKDNIFTTANYFSKHMPDIKVVSDDAFVLNSSMVVNIIIEAMRLIVNPDNKVSKAFLAKSFNNIVLKNNTSDEDIFAEDIDNLLPSAYITRKESLAMLPLHELAEQLFSIFQLDLVQNENAYMASFFDVIYKFINDNTSDVQSFLNAWDDTLCNKKIQPSEVDGIRLLTIHQSKGLEYDNVIIPFCDWNTELPNTIWCSTEKEPFNKLPLIPIQWSKEMKETVFEKDYCEEYLQNTVDNINLLYVAFTRAVKNLFVLGNVDKGKRDGEKKTNEKAKGKASQDKANDEDKVNQYCSTLLRKCLKDLPESLKGATLEKENLNDREAINFQYGELCLNGKEEQNISENIFTQKEDNVPVVISSSKKSVHFIQSNKSRTFTDDKDDTSNKYIKAGLVLHGIFSSIIKTDDIDAAILQAEFEGVLRDCGMDVGELRKMLQSRVCSPKASDWFSGKWRVFNECSILSFNREDGTTETHRPDRVMTDGKNIVIVDFKFARPRPEYISQVENYKSLIRGMGYENVRGFLWYVYPNIIEEV